MFFSSLCIKRSKQVGINETIIRQQSKFIGFRSIQPRNQILCFSSFNPAKIFTKFKGMPLKGL